nr:MAG TPA: hypothetical protein [Caudoviricetes sp.]
MGMESGSGLSVADALALQNKDNDGMFGGSSGTWVWVFFLFFLLAWGGGGFGFGNNAAAQGALTRAELYDGLNYSQLDNAVRGIQNGLCDGFYAQNTAMLQGMNGIQNQLCQGFNGVNNNITESRFATQQCCCETNRNIDAVRYENARNTCDIVNAIKADGDATRALMTQNTIQELRDNLQAAQLQLGNISQTQTIINAVRPFPIPSYVTCSPYTAANGYGVCGCGNGCGC